MLVCKSLAAVGRGSRRLWRVARDRHPARLR